LSLAAVVTRLEKALTAPGLTVALGKRPLFGVHLEMGLFVGVDPRMHSPLVPLVG
jgi:hypothetical protein